MYSGAVIAPFSAASSRTVALALAGSRASRVSRAPRRTSARAISLPIPLVAPVMTIRDPATGRSGYVLMTLLIGWTLRIQIH
ncbi:Uncharacterised protein [Mycobacteroides abscessus subsp. abscessus]|nr:Uncharacterised protein [Mycobacteroides abscessus subsp. abscessus]